jgi:hypothetical protein
VITPRPRPAPNSDSRLVGPVSTRRDAAGHPREPVNRPAQPARLAVLRARAGEDADRPLPYGHLELHKALETPKAPDKGGIQRQPHTALVQTWLCLPATPGQNAEGRTSVVRLTGQRARSTLPAADTPGGNHPASDGLPRAAETAWRSVTPLPAGTPHVRISPDGGRTYSFGIVLGSGHRTALLACPACGRLSPIRLVCPRCVTVPAGSVTSRLARAGAASRHRGSEPAKMVRDSFAFDSRELYRPGNAEGPLIGGRPTTTAHPIVQIRPQPPSKSGSRTEGQRPWPE